MMRVMTWAAVAAALLVLSGCSDAPPEPPPEPEVLSATKAGGLYLSAVCPVNEAWDRLDVEVDRLRIEESRSGGDGDTEAFAEAMLAVRTASERAAKQLEPKDRAWPDDAVDEVEAVRDSLRDDAKQAAKVAELPIEQATTYTWKGASEAGAAAAQAREVLGLPADPVAACTQWEEQAAEDAATDTPAKTPEPSQTPEPSKMPAPSKGE